MVIARPRTACHGSKRDRGAVMVEFALVLPLLVMLLVGIIQFGLAYSAQVSISGAAREGARALALGESALDVEAAVDGARGVAKVTGVDQTACPENATSDSTDYATVTVNATFEFAIPFVPGLGTRTHTATARMRCGL